MVNVAVSCIIPAYNSTKFIAEAIDSVRTQSSPIAEIIVVDDGSTDNTCKIVESYDLDIRLIRQSNIGPAAARNTGIEFATGDFISFLDADDTWHPKKTELQLKHFEKQADLDVCIGMVQLFWAETLRLEYRRLRSHPRAQPVPGYTSGTMLVRRRAFDRVGLFNEGLMFSDGPEWFMRAEQDRLNISVLPDVLLYHRMHLNNVTRRRAEESKKEFLKLARYRVKGCPMR